MGGRKGPRVPVIECFLEKVEKGLEETDCWIWTGKIVGTKSSYGAFSIKEKWIYAHRFIWEYTNGPIPTGLEIDHKCRNTLCVNPNHLEPVTPAENSRRTRKTVCVNGHDLTKPENQRVENGRHRGCYLCVKQRQIRYYYKNKDKNL